MNRKNRSSGKAGASRGRNEKNKTGKRDKHPFQKFVKDKPDREKSRRDKPAFPKEDKEGRRSSGTGSVKSEERRKSSSRVDSGYSRESSPAKRTYKDKSFRASENRTSFGGERSRPASRENSEPTEREGRKKRHSDKPFRSSGERSRDGEVKRKPRPGERSGFSGEAKREKKKFGDKPYRSGAKERTFDKKPKKDTDEFSGKRFKHEEFEEGRGFKRREESKPFEKKSPTRPKTDDGLIRLNKYLSNAGVASRRDADVLIISGAVKVNGVVVNQLGAKIKPGDKVTYGDQAVQGERKVYLLLNKPKDYITTMDDPRDRKTVMHLIEGACRERVYPVGRLDRNTTGLLLLTNDGELAAKLTHPKYGVKKVYHASINKGLRPEHFQQLTEGVELEDGMVKVDDIAFVGEGKKEIGLELHSGKNRVVRRLFEHLGYDVIKLDRVVFAGLTKKDLPRGKYRFLSPKEVSFLKMIG